MRGEQTEVRRATSLPPRRIGCPHVKEPRCRLFHGRRARCARRLRVRIFLLALALRLPRSSTRCGVRTSPCLFPFGFRRLPWHRRIVCALPRLGCLAGQVIAPAPTVSCNRLNSEDRAIPPKSLILQRRTIRNLLQVTGYVTGCISTVTTSVTLPAGPRALGRRNCDQYATPRHIAVRQYDGMRTERARQRVANLKQAPSQQKKAPILQPERSLDELGSTSRGR